MKKIFALTLITLLSLPLLPAAGSVAASDEGLEKKVEELKKALGGGEQQGRSVKQFDRNTPRHRVGDLLLEQLLQEAYTQIIVKKVDQSKILDEKNKCAGTNQLEPLKTICELSKQLMGREEKLHTLKFEIKKLKEELYKGTYDTIPRLLREVLNDLRRLYPLVTEINKMLKDHTTVSEEVKKKLKDISSQLTGLSEDITKAFGRAGGEKHEREERDWYQRHFGEEIKKLKKKSESSAVPFVAAEI